MRLTSSSRSTPVARPADQVYAALAGAGPGPHWYVDALPLRFRGGLDRLLGGGPAAPVPDRDRLRVGDRAGFWRVLRADHIDDGDAGGALELEAEVRAPGTVRLLTEVTPDERGYDLATRVTQTVSFAPAGLVGTAYLLVDLPAREALIELVHRHALGEARRTR